VLLPKADTADRALVAVTGPARRSRYELRVPAQVRRFGDEVVREPVLSYRARAGQFLRALEPIALKEIRMVERNLPCPSATAEPPGASPASWKERTNSEEG
jgi:hypothetical protein